MFRMLRHDWYLLPIITTTSVHCCRVFTSCGLLFVIHFVWLNSPTAAFTVQHPSTWQDNCSELLMLTHVNDFALHLPLIWLLCGPVEPPLVVDALLQLQPQSGTACQKQSVLQHLWRCSERHWIQNCSCDLIPTNRLNNCLHYHEHCLSFFSSVT